MVAGHVRYYQTCPGGDESGRRGHIKAVSFCSQMQCLVLVDEEGEPVRRAMSYMDNRASSLFGKGPALLHLLTWLRLTKAAPVSAKDPLWRYKWVEKHEPDCFARVHKWLDAKDYFACRLTGEVTMTEGSGFPTFLYDVRPGKHDWSEKLCRLAGVKMDHLPASSMRWACSRERKYTAAGVTPNSLVWG
ncbi:MAG: hypothetical protein GX838_02165 [Clostridiaceae bacterium]|nr:hypothetical protein [Clostridiaceae bacterium]